MKPAFVNTENARRFVAAVKSLEQRGASEACLIVVDGQPGLSKTTVTHWFAVQTGSVYLRAKREWTPAWFLRELLEQLRKQPEHSFDRMFRQAVQALGERADEIARQKRTFTVIIDEADYISRSRLLDTIRDLADMLELPFILVGMGRVRHNLTRFPQVASRVSQPVEFKPATIDDAKAMVAQLCEVPVADDLTEFVHRATNGFFREIKEAIAAIERFGKRNGASADQPVRLAQMAGETLFVNRATGNPVKVGA